jgi:serine/tyrosine/threonine adenylyltransferase
MSVAARPLFAFDNSFVRELPGLYEPWQAASAPEPRLLVLNGELAAELGAEVETLRSPDGVAVLVGNAVPEGAEPVAQAYSGHQFGGFSPRLGDGRALLLGEVLDVHGRRRDLHLKGSGRTPFARGGDGKAAVGPMLREYLIGEAMRALNIPTTRALSVVATGDTVLRETGPLPGAVLARVAASHLRVGTFQYAATRKDPEILRRLADYAIARHHPEATEADNPYLDFLERVTEAQASLVSQWMLVGFIHGVMNTDNMTISGETIDYGPCAFMEAFDLQAVFSSIDHGGRYAYGNQPAIAQWNLARLAETLLTLIDPDPEAAVAAATAVLETFPDRYEAHRDTGLRAKLGLAAADASRPPFDEALLDDLPTLLHDLQVDFTSFFRTLSASLRIDDDDTHVPEGLRPWTARWRAELAEQHADAPATADAMDRINPVYIPRNHHVEAALTAATAGDLQPFEQLLDAVTHPFDERPGLQAYAAPAPPTFTGTYRTFCGT